MVTPTSPQERRPNHLVAYLALGVGVLASAATAYVVRFRPELVSHRGMPAMVLLAGLVLSLLLFAVLRQEEKARLKADDAERRAAQLVEAAQSAVRIRDEFLSIASHELRTPLATLGLQAQSLLTRVRVGSPTGEHIQKKVGSMDRQLGRLNRLVNELLDVTRITAGRMPFDLEPVDLAAVVREVVDRFGDEVTRAGCQLRVTAAGPVRGQWDRMRLEQVVINLLSNAVKYGAHHPIEIEISPPGQGLAAEEQRRVAILRVTDHGIGIQQENLSRIFERFERAVSERNFGGMGLGLSIVRQIVEGLGGTIHVESDMGVGSAFTVRLPVETRAQAAGTGPQEPEPAFERARSEA